MVRTVGHTLGRKPPDGADDGLAGCQRKAPTQQQDPKAAASEPLMLAFPEKVSEVEKGGSPAVWVMSSASAATCCSGRGLNNEESEAHRGHRICDRFMRTQAHHAGSLKT